MEQLRTTRRQWKGVVTRHLGTLERLVTEEDSDGVNERLSKIRSILKNLNLRMMLTFKLWKMIVNRRSSFYQKVKSGF